MPRPAILVTNTFLTIVHLLGVSGTFLLYGFFCVLSTLFVLLLPETRGKTLEQIQIELGSELVSRTAVAK